VSTGLWYAEGREWKPLPTWARFFIEVGAAVGAGRDPDAHVVVAIVAPTRAYAAAFAALGVVTARATQPCKLNPGEHLRQLRSLDSGTPVFYVESGKKRKAVFLGCVSLPSGEVRLKLQFERTPGARESGGLVEWLPLSCAPRMRVADEASPDLPRSSGLSRALGSLCVQLLRPAILTDSWPALLTHHLRPVRPTCPLTTEPRSRSSTTTG
jgi:hypothetical protein